MGQTDSKKKIEEEFEIFKIEKDGNALLKSKKDSREYLMRIVTCSTQADMDRLKALLECRAQLKNHHILSLVEIKEKQQDYICSIHYKMYLVLEYSFKNLAQEIRERSTPIENNYFQESDIWSILYSCCTALNALYSNGATHESLTAEQIFINKDGFVKVTEPLLFGLEKNHLQAMRTRDENIINVHLSPEIIGCLDDQNFFYYDKEKSDIFVLAMIIIDSALLSNHFLYDVLKKKPVFEEIQSLLGQVGERYSQNLVSILGEMVRIESRQRPNLSQIIEKVEKCNNIGEDFTVETESNMKSNELSSSREQEKALFQKTGKYQELLKQDFPFEDKKKNGILYTGMSSGQQPSLFIKQPTITFNNQNFDGKVFVSTPHQSNFQGPQVTFPINYQQSHVVNVQTPEKVMSFPRESRNEVYERSSIDSIKIASNEYQNFEQLKGFTSIKPTNLPYKQARQFEYQTIKSKNQPIFSHEIPEVYNIIMNSKNASKIEGYAKKDVIIDKEPTPQLQSDFKKNHKFASNFKMNPHEVVSRFGEQPQSPSFHTIELKKNISQTQSEKPPHPSSYFKKQSEQTDPFSNINPSKNAFSGSSSFKPNPFASSNPYPGTYAFSSSAVGHYGGNNSPIISSSFIPNFPSPSKCQSFTCRSGFSHLALFHNEDEDLKLEFIRQQIPQRGRYEGYKHNDQRNGHGTLYFKDGGHYEGEWKNDKMHGFGKLYYENGKIAYEGHWQNDQFNGQGRVYNSQPIAFEQQFSYKDFSELTNKWTYYEGQFKNDSKHGKGYIKLTNGEMYEGIFDHDMIEGNGIFYKRTGEIVIGFWIDNKLFLNQSYEHEKK